MIWLWTIIQMLASSGCPGYTCQLLLLLSIELSFCELFQKQLHLVAGLLQGVVLLLQHVPPVLLLLLPLVVLLLLLNPDVKIQVVLLIEGSFLPHTEVEQLIPKGFWQDLVFDVTEMNVEGHTESLSLPHKFCPEEILKVLWKYPLKDPKGLKAFHVADQFHLTVELVSLRILGQLLHVVDGQGNQEVHHNNGDEDNEEEDGDVGEAGEVVVVDAVADRVVLNSLRGGVHQVFVIKLSGHHHQHLEACSKALKLFYSDVFIPCRKHRGS